MKNSSNLPPAIVGFLILAATVFAILSLNGCAVIRLGAESPNGQKAHGTLYAVDWPWRDLKQVASKANILVRTNAASISFKGDQESTVNTNALTTANKLLDTVGAIVGKAP